MVHSKLSSASKLIEVDGELQCPLCKTGIIEDGDDFESFKDHVFAKHVSKKMVRNILPLARFLNSTVCSILLEEMFPLPTLDTGWNGPVKPPI